MITKIRLNNECHPHATGYAIHVKYNASISLKKNSDYKQDNSIIPKESVSHHLDKYNYKNIMLYKNKFKVI